MHVFEKFPALKIDTNDYELQEFPVTVYCVDDWLYMLNPAEEECHNEVLSCPSSEAVDHIGMLTICSISTLQSYNTIMVSWKKYSKKYCLHPNVYNGWDHVCATMMA